MHSNKLLIRFSVIVIGLLISIIVFAQETEVNFINEGKVANVITSVPRTMTYQGILNDSGGDPVTDSVYSLTFRIFNVESGGTSLWNETLPCTTSTGVFLTVFNNVNLPFNEDYWLELEVGGEILEPRMKMNMVAYAARADTADYAFVSSGGSNGWVDDGTIVRLETDTDSVGIGTSIPTDKLDVDGDVLIRGKAAIGQSNDNSGSAAFVAGAYNTASGNLSVVSGGNSNEASGERSTIGGGWYDTTKPAFGGVFSGYSNLAGDGPEDTAAFVGGGYDNSALAEFATVGGGRSNIASEWGATVGGGQLNSSGGPYDVIGGGYYNTTNGFNCTIAGGSSNTASLSGSTVGGGESNTSNGGSSVVSGGDYNTAGGWLATVGGGQFNEASGALSVVCGGGDYLDWIHRNKALADFSSVGGGNGNTASGYGSTVGGGSSNTASGQTSTIAGGGPNLANGNLSTIGGGSSNIVEGMYATISGGYANTISTSGDYSYLFGIGSNLTEDSTFMVDMPHIRFGDETTGYEFPDSDGSADQVMATDGSGQLGWVNNTATTLQSELQELLKAIEELKQQNNELADRISELEEKLR
jgi:hypothetical protein